MAAVFVGGACAVADEHGAGLPVGETYEVAFARRGRRGGRADRPGGDERFDVLALDGGNRGGHALVCDERDEQGAVVRVAANQSRETGWAAPGGGGPTPKKQESPPTWGGR